MAHRQYWEARFVVAVLLGVATGYAVGASLAKDAERGRTLTMKAYVEDFDRHKAELESSDIPMAASIIGGTLLVVGVFGVYELLAFGLGRVFRRFRRDAKQPWVGVPPIDRGGAPG